MLAASCVMKWVPLLRKHDADVSWAAKYEDLSTDSEKEEEEGVDEDILYSDEVLDD